MPSRPSIETLRTFMAHRPWMQRAYVRSYHLFFPHRYGNYRDRALAMVEQKPWSDTAYDLDDMVRETLVFGTFFDEYLHYHFESLSDSQRREYLTDAVRNAICHRINDDHYQALLMDKYRASEYFEPFFRRQTMMLSSASDKDQFVAMGLRLHELVLKPIANCAGRGVRLLSFDSESQWAEEFDRIVSDEGKYIVEERIQQDAQLAVWNPSSVNTIRTNTILRNGEFSLFGTFLRMGRQGSFMDNCGQGGLMAAIDPQTGVIITEGADEAGHRYPSHPDNSMPFVGTQMPRWEELKSTAEKLARAIPQLTFVAWDLALTPDGWVMVEGNKGQFMVQQTTLQRGIRHEFEKACGL